ncbi:MAG: hypothetical protein KF868_22165 [Acidobacteria bacterium]|nr:hypothetical protein [Acidobacteriota bacterium]MCW5967594.1 hypothetical protein [Blastocatellales bacterium]
MPDENEPTSGNDPTQTLSDDETPEQRILSRLDAIDARLAALEAKAEERSRDTRPLFEQAIKEMQQTRETLGVRLEQLEEKMNSRFDDLEIRAQKTHNLIETLSGDVLDVRVELRIAQKRIARLEDNPAA